MLHFKKKPLSAQEKADAKRWQEAHRLANAAAVRAIPKQSDADYWAQQRRLRDQLRGLHGEVSTKASGPSVAPKPEAKIEVQLTPEEYAAREAAAQEAIEEKKLRVAPVYNKGGNQYYSDGMLESMGMGAHRRR